MFDSINNTDILSEEELSAAICRFRTLVAAGVPVEIDSYAEYGIYDTHSYDLMCDDTVRMSAFQRTLQRYVNGKTVLDVGGGDRVPLSIMAIELGAKKVIAVEMNQIAAKDASKLVRSKGLEDKIEIISSNILDLVLTEKADVCVSDMIGHIAGAEGAHVIARHVQQHLLIANGIMIPTQAQTVFTPIHVPTIEHDSEIKRGRNHYRAIVRHAVGKNDIRLRRVLYNVPPHCLFAPKRVLEHLSFSSRQRLQKTHKVHFVMNRSGYVTGFAAWLEIVFDTDITFSAIEDPCHWGVVIIEIPDKLYVEEGDEIHCLCETSLAEDGLHANYSICSVHERNGHELSRFSSKSCYIVPLRTVAKNEIT